MIKIGQTFGNRSLGQGALIEVYECEVCGYRSKYNECPNPNCSGDNKLKWRKND